VWHPIYQDKNVAKLQNCGGWRWDRTHKDVMSFLQTYQFSEQQKAEIKKLQK